MSKTRDMMIRERKLTKVNFAMVRRLSLLFSVKNSTCGDKETKGRPSRVTEAVPTARRKSCHPKTAVSNPEDWPLLAPPFHYLVP